MSKEITIGACLRGAQRTTPAVAGLCLSLACSTVFATGFQLGDAANYGVLFQGQAGTTLNINNGPGLNGLAANGQIGIGGAGHLQVSAPLTINGNVNFSGAAIDNLPATGVTLNGSVNGGIAQVQTDLNNLGALSTLLGAEAGASVLFNIGNGANQTVNASAGMVDASGNSVFTVSGVNFVNGATLTINGDGTHKVVFNLSSSANFGGKIVLSGGLTSDDVLFNFTGGSSATLSGGPTLAINSNGDALTGTFLDPNGPISLVHSILNGRLFGGGNQNASIVSGGELNAPTIPDAGSSIGLLALGLGLVVAAKRKLVR